MTLPSGGGTPGARAFTTGGVVRRILVVRGRVQGVGYRVSCARRAEAAGVSGWVRNRPDGSVEMDLEGPSDAVDALVDWARRGPPAARVTASDVAEATARGQTGFVIG